MNYLLYKKFENQIAIDTSYNGAWCFLTTYIILVLLSQYINKIVTKYNTILIIGISFIVLFNLIDKLRWL